MASPTNPTRWPRERVIFAATLLAVTAVLGLSYARCVFDHCIYRWYNESTDYLYGFLVVPFAIFLLWARRQWAPGWNLRGSYWGLALLGVGAAMRGTAIYFHFQLLEPMSLVPVVGGLVLLVGGWPALRWAGPSVLFLAFMVPLPGAIAGRASQPLQAIGTRVSTYILQTVGIPVMPQGNVILVPGGPGEEVGRLGVEEACSGLKMMTLFVAICFGAAFVENRSLVDRAVIIVFAVPISIVANVIRITVTGILYKLTSPELAVKIFHDLAGLLMMPLAIFLLWMVLLLWGRLLVAPATTKPLVIAGRPPARGAKSESDKPSPVS